MPLARSARSTATGAEGNLHPGPVRRLLRQGVSVNSQLLKRLFRAVGQRNDAALGTIARAIIQDERKKGHEKLAEQLESLLASASSESRHERDRPRADNVVPLRPLGGPRDLPAVVLQADTLPHHMVLRPDVEARFERIEREYAARTRLGDHGLRPRKRILLYGPPGCGKSLGAGRLAWTTGLPLMKVRFDTLVSSLFGETASNLRGVFDASLRQPCVLLLDECDFIARSRGGIADVGEASRIVNALLQILDDYNPPGLLVATTNMEGTLDPALFRRFDDLIQVPLPGNEEILGLLEMSLSAMRRTRDVDLRVVAAKLTGMSAAHVVRVAEEAAKRAVLELAPAVRQQDLVLAADELREGLR